MPAQFYQQLRQQLDDARQEGLFKQERIITSAQQTEIAVGGAPAATGCGSDSWLLATHSKGGGAAAAGCSGFGPTALLCGMGRGGGPPPGLVRQIWPSCLPIMVVAWWRLLERWPRIWC